MKIAKDIFSEQGALSTLVQGFRHRPQQEAMAQAIFTAIEKGEDLLCEAGTGVGKTLAYLAPVLLLQKKTMIATATRHLQDQIRQKDLPLLLDALKLPVKTTVLKGRANYLCLERMETALKDGSLSSRQMATLQEIKTWSVSTETGDINELHTIGESTPGNGMITSTAENCLGRSCPSHEKCFVFKNRKAAHEADLLITNHSLLLSDMVLREGNYGEVLPLPDVIIFDEAHQLPELATVYFSRTLGSRQFFELIRDIRVADREEAGDIPDLDIILSRFEKRVRDVRLIFGHQDDRRVNWQKIWHKTSLPDKFSGLLGAFRSVLDILEANEGRGKWLDNCHARAKSHYDYLENYSRKNDKETVCWAEVKGRHVYFNQTPINIAETFRQRLSTYNAINVFTSASLCVNHDFRYFNRQLGLDDIQFRIWDSPFDYKTQSLLYLPRDLPDPGAPDFFDAFVKRCLRLLAFSRGRAFILFTSHRSLERAAGFFSEQADYPLLVQGKAPRTSLLKKFRHTEHAILLGTNSFWEGVDVKGPALSLIIIEKLPFASPDNPVLLARLEYSREQGGNFFMEYQLPQAAVTLKQGVGRLIRDVDDRGVCAICDKRIINKRYGKYLMKSLPPMPTTDQLEEVRRFF